ncbi:MAG TPA: YetF domain-containing protein [Bryobacterales bacterium]|nr:YetF domain-containing protein [Bryobacterales bacterium]
MAPWSKALLDIVFRSAVVYAFVLAGMRLTGKREAGQLTPFDLVLLLLISNAVQNAMVGPDTSLGGGITAAATLLVMNLAVVHLVFRGGRVAGALRGSPTLLVLDGRLVPEQLKREELTLEDLSQAFREHGVGEISDVHMAVLEVDGSISVVRNDDIKDIAHHHRRVRILRH